VDTLDVLVSRLPDGTVAADMNPQVLLP